MLYVICLCVIIYNIALLPICNALPNTWGNNEFSHFLTQNIATTKYTDNYSPNRISLYLTRAIPIKLAIPIITIDPTYGHYGYYSTQAQLKNILTIIVLTPRATQFTIIVYSYIVGATCNNIYESEVWSWPCGRRKKTIDVYLLDAAQTHLPDPQGSRRHHVWRFCLRVAI